MKIIESSQIMERTNLTTWGHLNGQRNVVLRRNERGSKGNQDKLGLHVECMDDLN